MKLFTNTPKLSDIIIYRTVQNFVVIKLNENSSLILHYNEGITYLRLFSIQTLKCIFK